MRHAKRCLAVASLPVAILVASLVWMPAAGAADPVIWVVQTLDASTHVKKLDQTVQIPRGEFIALVDLANGNLLGSIALPPATVVLKKAGLPVAMATMQVQQTKLVTGHIDFTTFSATATSTFNIKVTKASPALDPNVNLVGNNCTTANPVTVTMTGTANLAGSSTFSGAYTIPPFKDCQLLTPILTQLVSGPGNTFTATATPKTQTP